MKSKSVKAREELAKDIRAVLEDSEELLKATAGQAGDRIDAQRTRVAESLGAAWKRLEEFEQDVVDQAKAAAKATDTYVHENPWQAVGVAAGLGLFLGLLIRRR